MTSNEEPQRCETLRDVEALSGRRAAVVGTYQQVDVRMRRKPPPVYAGHVAVLLGDGTSVLLEPSWSESAIRDPEERARYEGRAVEVIGVIHRHAPEADSSVAQLTGPCISPVESARLSAGEASR